MNDAYVGTELELFAEARHWKAYFSALIRPNLGSNVLEVGAGLGGTTAALIHGFRGSWLCLEPDPALAAKIAHAVASGELPANCGVQAGTLASVPAPERFDSILYIDVLEHIADDRGELERATSHLSSGGKLVILAPAYQWLFSPLDRAIGHFRRYSRETLVQAVPQSLRLVDFWYLDSVGLLASAGNRFITRSASASRAQVRLWDGVMVQLSRVVDPLLGHSFGKSVLGVWQAP